MASDWREKAKELAALVAALPEKVRNKVDYSLEEAVVEIHKEEAQDVNDAGAEEQLICMFDADGIVEVEAWLKQTVAKCEQEVKEGI